MTSRLVHLVRSAALASLLIPYPSGAAEPRDPSSSQWVADGRQLVDLLTRKHVDLHATVSKEALAAALERYEQGVETWKADRIRLELVRLAALPSQQGRNGHTGVWPFQEAISFSMLEIKFYWFEEGLYVVDADDAHKEWIGGRVVRIGKSSPEEIRRSLEGLISRDGPIGVLRFGSAFTASPEILQGLGHTTDADRVEIEVELASGVSVADSIRAVSMPEYRERFKTISLPPDHDERSYWADLLEDETVLGKYNLVRKRGPDGARFSSFVDDLEALTKAHPDLPIVIDLRENGGGDNTTYEPLLKFLETTRANREKRLYALIGRGTFSAAGNFVTDLEKRTHAILVGEETGGAPNQYGDSKIYKLAHSKIEVAIPTVYWEKGGPGDSRLTHSPEIKAPPKASEYFAGIDGAMEAVRRAKRTVD